MDENKTTAAESGAPEQAELDAKAEEIRKAAFARAKKMTKLEFKQSKVCLNKAKRVAALGIGIGVGLVGLGVLLFAIKR